ncbi:ABC transporter ATP-binding protein [Asticcacaulis excentricus]|uniref:ABC transporter related protein n=1 Tax=Asticcacaulis excentricus (strain ATCC 15261 / DSM 4724 / KCTC 12464 / NCIMB 9791 / VKM B-1370 / CB 48) TaxID=573065 RepID=E8RMQ0_ASTEC|nr:ABC transporter ATP-binding protein [Asticcacaulis excentricus]ADU13931.1 ABC transporter related protein [Asticcacaulis excentricus CB 48]
MSQVVELRGVTLEYCIYSVKAQSLRTAFLNVAVGGKMLKNGHDVIHVRALDNVGFSLSEGDRLGIIGHNGAGKTTLLKVLAGIYEPDSGLVSVKGRVSSMVDIGLGLDATLTGRENIIHMARRRGHSTKEILANMESIVEFSELGPFVDLPVKTYSAGMQSRLVFAVATNFNPDILLLDEWIGAGDAGFFEKAKGKMNEILEKSRVMILATHNFGLVADVCNKLLVLDGGKMEYFGDVSAWDFNHMKPITS